MTKLRMRALLAGSALALCLAGPQAANAGDDDKDRDKGRGLAFEATLSGAQEVPGAMTDTSGRLSIKFNDALSEARFVLRVNDGMAVTQAHLHCGRPGANGPVKFFLFGFVAGGVDVDGVLARDTLTNDDVTAADCIGPIGRPVTNIASLALAARDGLIYVNAHTVAIPSGEVRGQLLEK